MVEEALVEESTVPAEVGEESLEWADTAEPCMGREFALVGVVGEVCAEPVGEVLVPKVCAFPELKTILGTKG